MAAAGEGSSRRPGAWTWWVCQVTAIALLLAPGCAAPAHHCAASRHDIAPCGPACWHAAVRQWIVPQQFQGADFRSACRAHDRCYGDALADRRTCDDRFRSDLLSACDSSSFPPACRAIAGLMHCGVAVCGGWFKQGEAGRLR